LPNKNLRGNGLISGQRNAPWQDGKRKRWRTNIHLTRPAILHITQENGGLMNCVVRKLRGKKQERNHTAGRGPPYRHVSRVPKTTILARARERKTTSSHGGQGYDLVDRPRVKKKGGAGGF